MKYILGKKIEMSQVWKNEEVVPVTKIQAGPCVVVQVKTEKNDSYEAVQVGYGKRKEKNINKPQKNHTKGLGNFKYLREFRVETGELKKGDVINVETFEPGDTVQVIGVSKGRGFQGVVKRHGFHGQNASHGTKDQLRMPGSAGATGPAHVFKGMRMPGRMGNDQVTIKNLEIVEVDKEKNELLIKGAVPGARNGLVLISGEGDLKLKVTMPTGRQESEKVESNEIKKEEKIEDKELKNAEKVKTEEKKEETPKNLNNTESVEKKENTKKEKK